MSKRIYLFGGAITTLLLVCVQIGSAQTSQTSNTEEAALRQIVKQVEDAWNAHDGKAFAAPFAADADYVIVNGLYIKGRDVIEKGHVSLFATTYKESRNAATIKSIRFLRPDVAAVHVEWNLEYSAGGETRKGHAMNTMVMTKESGKWSISVFQNTPIQPPGR